MLGIFGRDTRKTVLYLDIDGVFNKLGSSDKRFLHSAVHVINILYLLVPELEIVVTSSWRYSHSLKDLQILFRKQGVLAPVVDVTAVSKENLIDRSEEIWEHLVTQKNMRTYLIIDDIKICDYRMSQHSIQTEYYSSRGGLGYRHLWRAIRILINNDVPKT